MQTDKTTEENIKQAARVIFTKKGLDGARMQEIADEANVNKGLLNYYFRSKEKLFNIVFDEAFSLLFLNTAKILDADISLEDKIKQIVQNEHETIIANPFLPLFIMNEVGRNNHLIAEKISSSPVKTIINTFSKQVKIEVKNGKIRNVSGEELFINIISMVMFPFIAQNLLQVIFERDETSFKNMIAKRDKAVTEFILQSIKI